MNIQKTLGPSAVVGLLDFETSPLKYADRGQLEFKLGPTVRVGACRLPPTF
jgi:hypothetical protein